MTKQMKKINISAALRSVAAVALAVFAVSCDDTKPNADGGKPDKIEIADIKDAKPGEAQSVTFKAAAVWTISSDKQWCTPDKSTGQAGDNTVSFTITDAEQVFDVNDVATISIFYGKESVGSFTIERAAKERVMVFEVEKLDENGDPVKDDDENIIWDKTDAMVFTQVAGSSSFRGKIRISANFDWELSTVPAWIDIASAMPNNSGDANAEPVIMWLNCITSQLETGAMSGDITFKDTDADKDVYTLKAEFAGTGDDFLYLEVEQAVTFDAEGKVVVKDAVEGADFLPATLYAAGGSEYGFITLIFDNGNFGGFDEQYNFVYIADWVHINPASVKSALNTTELRITVDEGISKGREAWVLLLPKAIYDEVKDTPEKLLNSDETEVLSEYLNYYVLNVKQTPKELLKFIDGYPEGMEWVYTPAANAWTPSEYALTIPPFSSEKTTVSFTVPGSKTERPELTAEIWDAPEWITLDTAVAQGDEDSDTYTFTISKNTGTEDRTVVCNLVEEGMSFVTIAITQQPAN